MGAFIVRRLLVTIVVLLLVSLISFSIMQLVPGDPAVVMAGLAATADQIQAIRVQFGLDKPFHVQLVRWYAGIAVGDMGQSMTLGRAVGQALIERLPATIGLALVAFAMTIVIGLSAGILAAIRQNTWIDQLIMTLAVVGVSVPSFWLGLILIIVFAVTFDLLPAGGYVAFAQSPRDWLVSLLLPAFSLALLQVGLLARITRSAMVETLRQDFIRTAKAKGLPTWMVICKHALMNVMVMVVTIIGIVFSLMLSGSVVIETVFSIPGLGRLMASAILTRDYPLIQGGLLLTAAMFVLINLVVDVLYAYLDPRIRYD
ncbi:MAG: ABC transporter permease [Rhodospirillaceae bacterium]|nr:ABC transporter permease [Rhodospirillaceae bacterium]